MSLHLLLNESWSMIWSYWFQNDCPVGSMVVAKGPQHCWFETVSNTVDIFRRLIIPSSDPRSAILAVWLSHWNIQFTKLTSNLKNRQTSGRALSFRHLVENRRWVCEAAKIHQMGHTDLMVGLSFSSRLSLSCTPSPFSSFAALSFVSPLFKLSCVVSDPATDCWYLAGHCWFSIITSDFLGYFSWFRCEPHNFLTLYQPIRADKTGTFYCQLKSAGLQWTTILSFS
jgi:hypothetical protein